MGNTSKLSTAMTETARRSPDEVIYERLAPELTRFATGLVGRDDAADVTASAFLRAPAAPTWPAVTNHRAYLYRTVLDEARTWARRRSQRPVREVAAAVHRRSLELPGGFDPAVADAVARLGVRRRAVIVLMYWADLSPAAIAERLGISEGSVRRHPARARARLREVLHAD